MPDFEKWVREISWGLLGKPFFRDESGGVGEVLRWG